MTRRFCQTAFVCVLILWGAATGACAQEVTYADVAPILQARCVMCHAEPGPPLQLRLDRLDALLKGSRNGPVVKPGNPEDSELIRRIKGLSQPRMPLTGPPFLSDEEIKLIERWVATGLKPGSKANMPPAAARSATRPKPGEPVTYAHVAPILAARCVKCHAPNGSMGPPPEGYRLTSYAATLSAADRVRVVPGSAGASELVRRIRGQARPRMPFDGPPFLSDAETALVVDWIDQGARDAAGNRAGNPTGARVRLHGTLRNGWKLDTLGLVVTSSTRIDKSSRAGDYVQVRGRVNDDGAIIAVRIRRR